MRNFIFRHYERVGMEARSDRDCRQKFTRNFALSPYSCFPVACRAALWLTPSRPEADHGAYLGQRRGAPARRWLVRLLHAARGGRRASSGCPLAKGNALAPVKAVLILLNAFAVLHAIP
jgi:hypothetical protein